MFTRSERLFLRPAWPEDWEELLARIGDKAVVRNLARAPWPYMAADAQAFAARSQGGRYPNFLVTLPDATGAQVIGGAGLARDGGTAELGYWIAPSHWGRGFATEAVRAVVRVARMLGHKRIVASHFTDNPASGRVLRKAGFVPTGQVRKVHSLGRGGDVPAVAHALELEGGEPLMPVGELCPA